MPSVWGSIELDPGERRRIAVGESELWLERREAELQIATRPQPGDPVANLLELPVRCRVATRAGGPLTVTPRLADRSVVGRLEEPVIVGSGDSVDMFIGTSVWAVVSAGDVELAELPLSRPQDTWFGPNPQVGQLCYASRTRGRLTRSAIDHRVDRAVVSVSIANRGAEPLRFERVRLPVPNLSLYIAGDGTLWTNQVLVRADEPIRSPDLEISDAAPELDGARLEAIAGPRQRSRVNVISRALGALL